jgi:hypothetical protein
MMPEPQQILLHAAQDAMREAAQSLRERGWPVELMVDYLPERLSYSVSLRYELPPVGPVPVETRSPFRGNRDQEASDVSPA